MTRHRLNVEYEYEFFLAGISCHERPYRLCWAINNALEIEMSAIALHAIALKKNNAVAEFSVFNFENRENETSFSRIKNRLSGDTTYSYHHCYSVQIQLNLALEVVSTP